MIDKKEAVLRVQPQQLDQLLHPVFDATSLKDANAARHRHRRISRSGGRPRRFTAEDAVELGKAGPVILVRKETTPDDIHGMDVAKGILTAVGGKSSHAAVVARGMGRPCVVGAGSINISERGKTLHRRRRRQDRHREGRRLDFDRRHHRATSICGQAKTTMPDPKLRLLRQAHELGRRIPRQVSASAPMPISRATPKSRACIGAEGIGLCRTEHMFFAEDRIPHMQAMILARDEKSRKKALQKLLPMQRKDFAGLFKAMDGFPVVIRTLDPPLHEFLPKREDLMVDLARLPYVDAKIKKEMSEKYNIPVGD